MQDIQENKPENIRIVSIKFRTAGKHYDFCAQNFELAAGDRVIVETDRGRALGTVVTPPKEVTRNSAPEDIKSVQRKATDEDLAQAASYAAREKDAFRYCLHRIQDRKMGMKLVRAEYLFDGSKIIFYFTADGRVDFRELVKDLAHHFHTRIEMRQIGVRDEAKITGGLGICGRELCCCTFLTDFTPVSVKMAKEQGLALNPSKISGQCGRLLCCLSYEFETYCSMKKCLPKCGKKVPLGNKEVEIVDQNVLAQTVTVVLEDGRRKELSAEDVEKGQMPQETPAPTPSRREGREEKVRDEKGREATRSKKPRTPRPARSKAQKTTEDVRTAETRPDSSPPPPETATPTAEGPREGRKRNRRRRPRRENEPRR
jgi:cell fate regulator YaaT (PSP1 superfamily)